METVKKKTERERKRTEHKLACCALNESVRAGWATVSVECADVFDLYLQCTLYTNDTTTMTTSAALIPEIL